MNHSLYLNTKSAALLVFLYFIGLAIAAFVADIIPALDSLLFYFTVSFLLSYLLLYLDGKKISVIGFIPRKKTDFLQLILGIGSGTLMFVCNIIIILLLIGLPFTYATANYMNLLVLSMFNLGSAFIQEFVFRGYPFVTLLDKYGPWTAQLCVAVPFGLMHVRGDMDITTIVQTMLTTGVGSLIFGAAYIKTRKLFLPTGIHAGWNFAQQIFLEVWHNRLDQHVPQANNAFLFFVIPYLLIMGITFIIIQKCTSIDDKNSNGVSA